MQTPAKFFYTYDYITNRTSAVNLYTSELNNFIGKSSENYENPLFFDINKYMNKNTKMRRYVNELSQYMKFSDNFFTYHFHSRPNHPCIDGSILLIYFLSNLLAVIPLLFILVFTVEKPIKYYGIYIFTIWNIILYIIYKCLNICFDKIYRIDCIFSRDFNRMFIGIVKYDKKSYINTFLFEVDNIDRFVLEKIGNKNIY